MLKYERSVTIRRPVQIVFDYMQDIEREGDWQPNLLEAEQTPAGPPAVGTRRRYVSRFMGRRIRNEYVYTEYEPNRRVAYRSTSRSDTQAAGEVVWKETAAGTEITMRFTIRPTGFLRFVPGSVLTSLAEKELDATLANLRTRLEHES